MKVLFILNIPSPYRVKFLDLLSEKCELTVIYDRHKASNRDENWYVESNKKYNEVFLKGINYSDDSSITVGFLKYLKKGQFDVIVLGGYATFTQMVAIMTLKLHRIPYCLNADGAILATEGRVKHRIKSFFIQGADRYLSTGKATDAFFVDHGAKLERISRYSFTSLSQKDIQKQIIDKEEKNFLKKEIGCKTDVMILSVGSPIHRKGFDILLEAMHQLDRDLELFIVGGEANEECQKLIERYDLQYVHFIPFLEKDALSAYYKAADLFVFPTRYDIWGLVINEAMGFGLPVITTDMCNAGLELVEDGKNGYIVMAENVQEMSQAIKKVLTEDDREMLGRNSLEKIQEYTLENMADEHMQIFNEMIQLHRGIN